MQSASFIVVKILTGIFALIPFRLLYLLSDGLFFCFYHLFKYRRKVVLRNLRNAFPHVNEPGIEQLSRQFYRHFCDLLLESIKGLTLPQAELQRRFVYTNPEIFDRLYAARESAILLGSHYGNWEWGVLSFPLAVRHTVLGIYKPLKNRQVDAYLNRLRKKWGLHLVSMAQTGRAVVQYRNQPTIFVLIADQTPASIQHAHWLEFLHQDTPFLPGADKLARRTGYPVFVVDIERVKRGFYEVTFTELTSQPQAEKEEAITTLFARHLEATIRRRPADWLWSHRRWKRKRGMDHDANDGA